MESIQTVIYGRQVRLVVTQHVPGMLLDTWEDLGKPAGSVFRVGVVASIRQGQEATAQPFIPWASAFAVAYVAQPDHDPVARFEEALLQERERARERMTDGEFHQVQAPVAPLSSQD